MLQKLQGVFFDPHAIICWLLMYVDTSNTSEGGLAWVKGNSTGQGLGWRAQETQWGSWSCQLRKKAWMRVKNSS